MEFKKFNANPKGKKTGDCVIRAICTALDKSWEDTYESLFVNTMKTYYSLSSKQNFKNYLKKLGYQMEKMPKKSNGKKYTVKEFIDELATLDGIYLINIANHLTVVKSKTLIDTWNCSHKCVGNYWIIK